MEKSTSSKIDAAMSARLQSISLKNQSKSTSIDKLDDYCLDKVFSYLRIDDRACCERVCHRWKKVIQDSWLNLKILDLSESMWDQIVKEYKQRNDDTLMNMRSLSRFGQYLKKLELISRKKLTCSDLLWNVCKYCPNIEILRISSYPISPQLILELSKRCKQISYLSMLKGRPGCEESLSKLFRNNRKLNSIHIKNFLDVTGKCFLYLPSANSIKEMMLLFCRNTQSYWLNLALTKFVNLSYLSLHRCAGVDESTLQIISKLTELTLFIFHPLRTQSLPIRALHYLVGLVNLKYLGLSHESLTDDLLHDISIHCKKLEEIGLECEFITDRGIMALLENLENLIHLSVIGTRMTQATLEAADRIAALRRRKLSITCSMINSRKIIFLPRLMFLDLHIIEYVPYHHSRDFLEEDEIFIST